ncbi:glycerate kinase, partial [Streptomyces sp. NPDC001773]
LRRIVPEVQVETLPVADGGDGTVAAAVAAGFAEVVQEPTEQPYGIRDCAFRDPAGNLVRIQELR